MNSTLKGISLNLLLRNFFAGVFFLGSIYRGGVISKGDLSLAEILASGTLLALVAGTLVYAIHRTLFNPWIEKFRYGWLRQNIQESEWFKSLFLSEDAIDLLVNRWDNTLRQEIDEKLYEKLYEKSDEKSDVNNKSTAARYRGLASWADYIHLFYCSGLSITLGSLVNIILDPDTTKIDPLQLVVLITFLALGLLSDIRRQYVEDRCIGTPERLKRKRPTPKKNKQPTDKLKWPKSLPEQFDVLYPLLSKLSEKQDNDPKFLSAHFDHFYFPSKKRQKKIKEIIQTLESLKHL